MDSYTQTSVPYDQLWGVGTNAATGRIADAYRQYLGREASADEIYSHLGGANLSASAPHNVDYALNNIRNSDEARAYQQRQAAPAPAAAPTTSPVDASGRISASAPAAPTAPPAGAIPEKVQLNFPDWMKNYQPQQLTQYKDTNPGLQQSTAAILQQVLANPLTMSPEAVAQLKQKNSEEQVQMRDQALGALAQRFAGMNRTGAGAQVGASLNLEDLLARNVLASNREIDLQKVARDRADQLAAAQAGQQFTLGQYNATLQGEQGQQAANTQSYLAALQKALTEGQFTTQQGQFNAGLGIDWAKLFENARQSNNALGFNYANLNQSNQNDILRVLLGGGA